LFTVFKLARTGKMKSFIVSIIVLAISVAISEAQEIDGKWGLGAGIYGRSDVSILRGVSHRTALLGSISLRFEKDDGEQKDSYNGDWDTYRSYTSIDIVTEWRRYIRAEEKISPYFGLGPLFNLSHREDSYDNDRLHKRNYWNAGVGFTLGTEYFVNEYLSISTHLPFLRYLVTRDEHEDRYNTNFNESKYWGHEVSFYLNPSLGVRLYF
jgi:hypothetical protein